MVDARLSSGHLDFYEDVGKYYNRHPHSDCFYPVSRIRGPHSLRKCIL